MYCSECGASNPETNQFCQNCGKPLLKRKQPEQAPPATPSAPAVLATAPVPASPSPAPGPVPVPAAAPGPKRNWLGIASLIPAILSWGVMTIAFGSIAVLLGAGSLLLYRRASGRIGISSLIAIVLGIGAIAAKLMLA